MFDYKISKHPHFDEACIDVMSMSASFALKS